MDSVYAVSAIFQPYNGEFLNYHNLTKLQIFFLVKNCCELDIFDICSSELYGFEKYLFFVFLYVFLYKVCKINVNVKLPKCLFSSTTMNNISETFFKLDTFRVKIEVLLGKNSIWVNVTTDILNYTIFLKI